MLFERYEDVRQLVRQLILIEDASSWKDGARDNRVEGRASEGWVLTSDRPRRDRHRGGSTLSKRELRHSPAGATSCRGQAAEEQGASLKA